MFDTYVDMSDGEILDVYVKCSTIQIFEMFDIYVCVDTYVDVSERPNVVVMPNLSVGFR